MPSLLVLDFIFHTSLLQLTSISVQDGLDGLHLNIAYSIPSSPQSIPCVSFSWMTYPQVQLFPCLIIPDDTEQISFYSLTFISLPIRQRASSILLNQDQSSCIESFYYRSFVEECTFLYFIIPQYHSIRFGLINSQIIIGMWSLDPVVLMQVSK